MASSKIPGIVFVFLALALLAGALTIPFVYESQTLWYKYGHDKTILLAGKIAGILGGCLLFFRLSLGSDLEGWKPYLALLF